MACALRLLSRRDHSRRELKVKLEKRGFAEVDIATTLASLEAQGWLNDRRAAHCLAEELFERRGYGSVRVLGKLRERGFSAEEIQSVLEAFAGEEAERKRARKALIRFGRSLRPNPGRAKQFLERRGFEAHVIVSVLGDAEQECAFGWSGDGERQQEEWLS